MLPAGRILSTAPRIPHRTRIERWRGHTRLTPLNLESDVADVSKEAVIARLKTIPGPDGHGDLISLGLVSDVFVSDGRVAFSITVPADRARDLEPLRVAAERSVLTIPGVERAMVALTAERGPGAAPPRPAAAHSHGPGHSHSHGPGHSHGPQGGAQQPAGPAPKAGVPGVGALIAVASGKAASASRPPR